MQIVIHEHAQFGGETFEVYGDVEDSTSMKLSPVISIKVIRGWYGILLVVVKRKCIFINIRGVEKAEGNI